MAARAAPAWFGQTLERIAACSSTESRMQVLEGLLEKVDADAEVVRAAAHCGVLDPGAATALSRLLLLALARLSCSGLDVCVLVDALSDSPTAGSAALSSAELVMELVRVASVSRLVPAPQRVPILSPRPAASARHAHDPRGSSAEQSLLPADVPVLAADVVVVAMLSRGDLAWRLQSTPPVAAHTSTRDRPSLPSALSSIVGILCTMYVISMCTTVAPLCACVRERGMGCAVRATVA